MAADACAVMALERIPADIHSPLGRVSRVSIENESGIPECSFHPVASRRIGHFVEAQVLGAIKSLH